MLYKNNIYNINMIKQFDQNISIYEQDKIEQKCIKIILYIIKSSMGTRNTLKLFDNGLLRVRY